MQLSIIIPAFNEFPHIKTTVDEVVNTLKGIPSVKQYEIIVVDDHSFDGTYKTVQSLKNQNIKCIRLSKRSGSHVAIRAGLARAQGEAALFLSADGQDNPEAIPEMLSSWQQGHHIVWALRKSHKGLFFQELCANLFYGLLRLLTPETARHIDLSKADFCLLDKKALKAFNACHEHKTSVLGLIVNLGFKQGFVLYNRRKRRAGNSKWTFIRRLNIAKDWILAFSGVPLKIITGVGFCITVLGFVCALWMFVYALRGYPPQGWASTTTIFLVIGGIQMMMLGVIGEYLWQNLEETRGRPLYFIEKSTTDSSH